jgi:GT2 family glycosyltransferase/glycosyltransferase involved in cell wall biosynthesis
MQRGPDDSVTVAATAPSQRQSLSPSRSPGVTVVVPTYESAEHISRCLASARKLIPDAELIVVDNGSADATCEVVRRGFPDATLLSGHGNVGFGRACNMGAARASKELLLYLNPDAELIAVEREALAEMWADGPLGMVAAMVSEGDRPPRPTLRRSSGHWLREFFGAHLLSILSRFQPRPRYVRQAEGDGVYTVGGAVFLVSRDEFQSLGGFDERFFMYYEDTDLTQRYRAAGYPLRSSPVLLARHLGGASAPIPRRNALSFLGWLEYVDKWHGAAAARRGARVARVTYAVLLGALRLTSAISRSGRVREKREELAAMLAHVSTQGLDGSHGQGPGGSHGEQRTRYPAAAMAVRRPGSGLGGSLGLAIHRVAALARGLAPTGRRDPRRVAVVCDSFLHCASPQAIALRETGLEVTLYYVDRGSDFSGSREDREAWLARARENGVEVVPVPRLSVGRALVEALWLHGDLRRRRIAMLVVHSHSDPRYATLGLAYPVALILHDPQTHSGDELSSRPLPIRLIARAAELSASCLIIHSDRLCDQLMPLLRRLPLGVIPLGIEVARAPARVPERRRLLIFGRLFAYKGVDTALEAFELLADELGDAELVVAGRGPLVELARGRANVRVRDGYIPESEIVSLLEQARLVLLPYKDATQSGVGLQAIARGVPCVVSSAGGLPELVPEGWPDLIVPPGDPERLAAAIAAHVDHGEELRRAVHAHALANFAPLVAARRLRAELARLHLPAGEAP